MASVQSNQAKLYVALQFKGTNKSDSGLVETKSQGSQKLMKRIRDMRQERW